MEHAPHPVFYQVPAAPRPVPIPALSFCGGGYAGGGRQGDYGGSQSARLPRSPVRVNVFQHLLLFHHLSIFSHRPILPATNSSDSLRGRT